MFKLFILGATIFFTAAFACGGPPDCGSAPSPCSRTLRERDCSAKRLYLSTACACFVYNHCGQLTESEVGECTSMFGAAPEFLWPNCNKYRNTMIDSTGSKRLLFTKVLQYIICAGTQCSSFHTDRMVVPELRKVPVSAGKKISARHDKLSIVSRHFTPCTTKAGICNCFSTIRNIFTSNPLLNPLVVGTTCPDCAPMVSDSNIPDFYLPFMRVFKGMCPPFA